MEFLFDSEFKFNAKLCEGEQIPEISVVTNNGNYTQLVRKFENCAIKLVGYANQRVRNALEELKTDGNQALLAQGSLAVQELVFQCANQRYLKLYLCFRGVRLINAKKYRDGIRFLETANGIVLEGETCCCRVHGQLQFAIESQLKIAYERTGQYRKYLALAVTSEADRLKILNHKPFPVWQEEADYDAREWEKDLFGSSYSRTVSCEVSNGKLVAKRDFNFGEVIFVDKPVVGYVENSKGQCSFCGLKTLHTVPCTECREMFYCGVACLRTDAHFHKYECPGYRLLFFPLFNCTLVLRMTVKAMDVLKRNLSLRDPTTGPPSTVAQLWQVLLEEHDYADDFLKVLQGCTCAQYMDDKDTFGSLLQRSKIILYYILYDGRLLQDYKTCWSGVSKNERNTFLESVLLRVQCCAYSGACGFNYELAYDKSDVVDMLKSRWPRLDPDNLVNSPVGPRTTADRTHDGTFPMNREGLLMYWDFCWAKANSDAQDVAHLDVVEYALKLYSDAYHSTFDFVQHLSQCDIAPKVTTTNKYTGFYSFQRLIETSAPEPNTIFVLLDHGAVVFRAARHIKQGETLRLVRSKEPEESKQPKEEGFIHFTEKKNAQIVGEVMTETVRMTCKLKMLSGLVNNNQHKPYLCNADNFFDCLTVFDCLIEMYDNIPQQTNQQAEMFKLLNKVDRLYNHARMLPYTLMQDDWMVELIKRGPKLRLMKHQNNENIVNELYNAYFKRTKNANGK